MEMLKLLAPVTKAPNIHPEIEDLDSDTEDVPPTITSTPVKNKTTARKNTPTIGRNK